ncbi:hypothetical protein MKW98_031165, partial [Papaver atlanticum]
AICSVYNLLNNFLTFHNVKILNISGMLSTNQGLIALLKAAPNLESLVFEKYMEDEIEDSDEDSENDSDGVEGDGDDDNGVDDADTGEGENNIDNEDAAAECGVNDECEDDSWVLDIVTNGCFFPQLKIS